MARMTLHLHPWNEQLGVEGRWLGLANHRGHGYTPADVHLKALIAILRHVPILRRIAVRITAHEVQHAAGDAVERIHHDRPIYTEKTGEPTHECGMSTTVRYDQGSGKGRISWGTVFTYEHLSPWAIRAAEDLLRRGFTDLDPAPGSPMARHLDASK